jgi:cysteinyl-tRNA synthetase
MRSFRKLMMQIGVIVLVQPAVSYEASGGESSQPVKVEHDERVDLAAASSWGYQLQAIEPTVLAATPYDVLVIDYSSDGIEPIAADDLAALKHKLDGQRRIVLCYLSIGEAEDYRFYWNARWAARPPAWLRSENVDWPGNYQVQYWDRDWQGLIYGGPGAYLDRIIAAGFDGVYLDRVDAFDTPDPDLSLPVRMADMSRFVQSIAQYARAASPDFLILVQNGEELLADEAYRETIDGMGKEDLFFGIDGDGIPNARADIRASLTPIAALIASGKPVFLVEYLTADDQIQLVRRNAAQLGMPVFIADRELDHARSR